MCCETIIVSIFTAVHFSKNFAKKVSYIHTEKGRHKSHLRCNINVKSISNKNATQANIHVDR